jgi:glycogen(starch) synthase
VTIRVAQFSFEYPPLSTGGMGTYLKGLVEDHRRRGAHVDLYFLGPTGLSEPHIWTPAFESQIHTYSLPDLLERGGSADYDIVVCQDWPGVLVSQPLWKRGIPLVYTCQLPLSWDLGDFDDIPSPASAELEFVGVASADLIIACGAATEDALLQQYPFVAGKTMVIHNGTSIDFFERTNGDAQPNSGSAPILSFVGRYVEQKGFDRLPEIFEVARSLVPDLQLEIMGVGPLEASVRRSFDARGLSEAVTWHSFADQAAVKARLCQATVVVIPSRLEPFGLIATEAMAAGCAIVSSNTGGLGESQIDNVTGLLIPPEDIQGFGAAIARLAKDGELAARLGQAAARHAATAFSEQQCCQRTFQAYTDLARRGPR